MEEIVLASMMEYFGADVRRINHALKVYGFTKAISGAENLEGKTALTAAVAAILHDIGIPEAERKHGSSAGHLQEREGPPVARSILERLAVPAEVTERVCTIVGGHHSYGKIDGVDFRIVVEADFLVNVFEDGMEAAAVDAVRERVFRTAKGKALLASMYGKKA